MNLLNSQNEKDALLFDTAYIGRTYRLSRNFTVGEFASKDGAHVVILHPALLLGLQALRDHVQRPITINSGYRSPSHNASIGGASSSYHTRGMAADITIAGMTPLEVASLANDMGFGGIKAYPSFTHVDVGPKRTW
jgi:uncharacterized protein YcbK (DUF882 family)